MGICGSCCDTSSPEDAEARRLAAEQKRQSALIDQQTLKEQTADRTIHKLLLLGAGESGKSTLFKQMITIYGKGFPEEERKTFCSTIYDNVITGMKILCRQSEQFGPVDVSNTAAKTTVEELKGDERIDTKLGELLQQLWADKGIQSTYQMRSSYQLPDSTAYFMERLHEIMLEGYIPSEQDVLRSRVRTTGIVENEFTIDQNQFKMFDVGGQRNERKKWIHCFENVTAVLFVAAISEYDQVLFEDESTSRIVEALNLFEEICNSQWFRETAMILFLNKRDLFTEKIKKVPLSKFFPDYTGDDSFEHCSAYLQWQFESRNHTPEAKQVYTHITCATDTGNIAAVFNAVKDIVIRKSLNEAGLV